MTELNELPAVIVVNKIDLDVEKRAEELFDPYAKLGYTVIYTSIKSGDGIKQLREQLDGNITVLTGSSGVGKSSLLNAMQPGLGLEVGAVSEATTKGMHTTRYPQLIPLEEGGYIADTPGIRGVALFNVAAEELDSYFVEIAPLVSHCPFSDCSHTHEPGCAVVKGVASGVVSAARYDSYLRLREEHKKLYDEQY